MGGVTANIPCPHGSVIALLIVNRLQAPKPLYKVQEWLAQSGLEDNLGSTSRTSARYAPGRKRSMRCTKQHQAIWQEVALAAVRRYHLPLDWLHYDITSTYFEGAYSESELIRFGYSRDRRAPTASN